MNKVIEHIRRVVRLQAAGERTDGQLLESFVRRREATALEALVRRHSPMVWGVCRRILHNHHDAEDAFQATFLVLVRKAASVKPREMVGNWLYGVAHQTALKARATRAKRQTRERQVAAMPEPAATELGLWRDLQPVLDQELSRLPDKYRVAIVLCDLEGKTRKEAARQLGCPEGTLAARLTRGRVMLAKRLAARGLAITGGVLAGLLSQQAASAGAPASVVSSTIKAVTLIAAGQAASAGLISTKVIALTEGVLKTMFVTKIKSALAVVLVVGLTFGGIGAGIGLSTTPAAVAQQPAQPDGGTEQKAKAMETDWRIRALDVQLAELRDKQKQAEQEAARLNKQSAAIEGTIGELLAQRGRFLKKAGEETNKGEAKDAPLLVEGVLESIDAKNAVISAALGENEAKAMQMLMSEVITNKNSARAERDPMALDKAFKFVYAFNKPPKLVDVPVRPDAKIMSGKDALKLKDLQPGQVVSLQLATDPSTGLVIVGVQVVDKPVKK